MGDDEKMTLTPVDPFFHKGGENFFNDTQFFLDYNLQQCQNLWVSSIWLNLMVKEDPIIQYL